MLQAFVTNLSHVAVRGEDGECKTKIEILQAQNTIKNTIKPKAYFQSVMQDRLDCLGKNELFSSKSLLWLAGGAERNVKRI